MKKFTQIDKIEINEKLIVDEFFDSYDSYSKFLESLNLSYDQYRELHSMMDNIYEDGYSAGQSSSNEY